MCPQLNVGAGTPQNLWSSLEIQEKGDPQYIILEGPEKWQEVRPLPSLQWQLWEDIQV